LNELLLSGLIRALTLRRVLNIIKTGLSFLLSIQRLYIFGGPRYEMFTGNFKYVGGNEDFDVLTDQWGVGTGLQGFFRISPKIDLTLSAGVDYYFSSMLKGHDTEYYPDGEHVNPREDFGYSDANKAIDQPEILPSIMIGINYKL